MAPTLAETLDSRDVAKEEVKTGSVSFASQVPADDLRSSLCGMITQMLSGCTPCYRVGATIASEAILDPELAGHATDHHAGKEDWWSDWDPEDPLKVKGP